MAQNNDSATKRPCELAPHSHLDRLAEYLANSECQYHDCNEIAKVLNVSTRQAGALLKQFVGESA